MSPMSEHPVFVPVGGDHMAAVLAVPEAQARGLVLLLPGFGVGRSHKTRIWTLVARALADRDIASIRLDYRGHGDSTGSVEAVEFATPAMEEAVAAADLGKRLVGVETVGVAGQGYGTRTAIWFAEGRDDCISAALVMLGGFHSLFEHDDQEPERTLNRREAPILRVLRRGAGRPRGRRPSLHFIPEVSTALASTDLLFVLPALENRRRVLQAAIDEVAATDGKHRGRIGVETLQVSNAVSASIPVEAQPALVAMITDWMDRTLPGRAPEPAVYADGT